MITREEKEHMKKTRKDYFIRDWNAAKKDQFANLVRYAVAYAISNSSSQTNWIARELFIDVIPEELISEIFDK